MWYDTLRTAELFVDINLIKIWAGQYLYWISLNVIQKVSLMRPNIYETLATTWSTSSLGIIGPNTIVEIIRSSLGECVDKFIKSYSSVNPK